MLNEQMNEIFYRKKNISSSVELLIVQGRCFWGLKNDKPFKYGVDFSIVSIFFLFHNKCLVNLYTIYQVG